ncbi:MAG TPA: adenylate/guanylate cyclase domain-containing protein [Polyangiaceae bacterium]|nr:adenylate/guanylate cyclase domain-containing protein [Polyangiaceae bacterium]
MAGRDSSRFSDLTGSEVRLWELIARRAAPGADRAAIDRRIWDLFGERWAVMFTDLSGFSRQVARFGILHFLEIIWEQKRLLLPIVAEHDGILVKIEADSFLILFRRPEVALACGIAMQRACQAWNVGKAEEEQVLLCLGIGFGDILRIGDSDVYGAEVNAASKLGEDRAKKNEILVTGAVHDATRAVGGVTFEKLVMDVPGAEEAYRVGYERA